MSRSTGQRTSLCAACILLLTAGTGLTAGPRLRFLKPYHMDGLGMDIKLMQDAREVPLDAPTTYAYRKTEGDETSFVDMYDPMDLWRRSQHAGQWVDTHGDTMVIATVRSLPPVGFSRPHVTREEYDDAVAHMRSPKSWSDTDLQQWMTLFSGRSCTGATRPVNRPIQLRELIRFAFEAPDCLGYAFRANRSGPRFLRGEGTWYAVLFIIGPHVDVAQADREITDKFVPAISLTISQRKEPAAPSKDFQKRATGTPTDRTPEFIESRNQVAASIANLTDWWYVETDNYIFLSNLGNRHRVLVKELQSDIEFLRAAYAKTIPARKPVSAVSVVRVFATQKEYVRYVGPEHAWSGGVWMPMKQELIIRPIDWARSEKPMREQVTRTVYHEAFHQYVYYALDRIAASAWFNEGHAVFFENAEMDRNGLRIKENLDMVRTLERLLVTNEADVPRLLRLGYPSFYAEDPETRRQNYALAWGLVYYLRKGTAVSESGRHKKVLDRYVEALWETRDPLEATEQAFKWTRMEVFLRDFEGFWISLAERNKATRLKIFATHRR